MAVDTRKLLEQRILEWGRGRIFFISDFNDIASYDCIRHSLCTLVREKFIVRLSRGIYCFPKTEGEYSVNYVFPDAAAIAEALAANEKIKIIPYGDEAAWQLGLTTLRVSSLKYLTDGSPRVIMIPGGKKIYLNHTSEVKMFAFVNRDMALLSSAIRGLGEDYICTEEKASILRRIVSSVPQNEYQEDIKLPPAWVSAIIEKYR